MSKLSIAALIWTEWNKEHIARHNVSAQEVEQVIESKLLVKDTYDNRYLIVGTTHDQRVLAVILGAREENQYFVITARSASRKERREYRALLEED